MFANEVDAFLCVGHFTICQNEKLSRIARLGCCLKHFLKWL